MSERNSPSMAPLAVSLGDPAGIGPELIAQAWFDRAQWALPTFAVIGGVRLLAAAAASRGLELPVEPIAHMAEAEDVAKRSLPVLGSIDGAYRPGEPDRDGAELALASLLHATELTVTGEASALVTGPVAKSRLAGVGFAFPGQTEFVAHA